MKTILLLLYFFLLLNKNSSAQPNQTFIVKVGNSISDVLTFKDMYQYPEFVKGTVFFKDGGIVDGKLNYNLVIGEMQFIDPKGDTLSLANENTIKKIVIVKDSFYYNNGYLLLIKGNASAKLGKKLYFKEIHQKMGAYGLPSSTTAITNYSSILGKKLYDLKVTEELVLIKTIDYYFAGNNDQFVNADKKNVLKLFSKEKNTINVYLDKNPVNFGREEDLVRLFVFLQGLPN